MKKPPISIAIVEDVRGTREHLTELLKRSPGLQCVGAFASGEEALRELPALAPNVVLMDINLPGMNGAIEAAPAQDADSHADGLREQRFDF